MSTEVWRVEIQTAARKSLNRLAFSDAKRITEFIDTRLHGSRDPTSFGKALTGNLKGHWRYRVGDYRIIARIEKGRLLILVIDIDHRGKIYR